MKTHAEKLIMGADGADTPAGVLWMANCRGWSIRVTVDLDRNPDRESSSRIQRNSDASGRWAPIHSSLSPDHAHDTDRRRFAAELVMTVAPTAAQLSPGRAASAESALLLELVKAAQREMRQENQSERYGSATDRLLRQIYPRIENYCRRRLGRADQRTHSAEDVVQEIVIVVLRAVPKYEDRGFPFMAFVYTLAERKLIDIWRKNSRDRSSPVELVPDSPDGTVTPEEHLLSRELGVYLDKLLEILPDKQRRALWLRLAEDLSAAETAMRIGSTPSSVRVMQHRGLSTLRSRLAHQREQLRRPIDGGPGQETLHQPRPTRVA
ncbi:sigma-70 family RNA polymerase sigma factor [Amycolatopsis thailandensis]|uniref:sigma-70 family RNA polymerase sigma factor n=1 Tax=Amycolatopsis thailandensis TaxID=589330 RepID=UPI0036339D83